MITPIRLVIALLGSSLLIALLGIIALSLVTPARSIPDVLQNIAVGSLTALGALLVRSPTQENTP